MTVISKGKSIAKPFLKWAGGKSQLIQDIENHLPDALIKGELDTYVEPFVGGGVVFFLIAQKYSAIEHFFLLDINEDLINCFKAIQNNVESVIRELRDPGTEVPFL